MESSVLVHPDELQVKDAWIPCDACHSAKAAWLVKGTNGELFLCGHHYGTHEHAMISWAKEVVNLEQ